MACSSCGGKGARGAYEVTTKGGDVVTVNSAGEQLSMAEARILVAQHGGTIKAVQRKV